MKFWLQHLDILFADFGILVELIQFGKSPIILRVIENSQYQQAVEMGGFAGVSTMETSAKCKSSDVEDHSIVLNDKLKIDSKSYYIREVIPENYGVTSLLLSKEKL